MLCFCEVVATNLVARKVANYCYDLMYNMSDDLTSPFALEDDVDIASSDFKTTDDDISVLDYLRKKHASFLMLIGFYWPTMKNSFPLIGLLYLWNLLVRFSILTYALEGVIMIWAAVASELLDMSFGLTFGIILIVQSFLLVPIFRFAQVRLQTLKARRNEFQFYEECIRYSIMVFAITATFGFILPIEMSFFYFHEKSASGVVLYIAVYSTIIASACCVSANVFFALVDMKVCLHLVKDLISRQQNKSLSMKQFNTVRDEIEGRVQSYQTTNNAILFLALLDVSVGLLILLLYSKEYNILVIFALVFSLLKEAPYVITMLLRSAEINENVDQLSAQLGLSEWDETGLQEMLRVKLYINSQAKLISYPMAGFRLKVRSVMLQIAGWLILFAVGLIKSIIISTIG